VKEEGKEKDSLVPARQASAVVEVDGRELKLSNLEKSCIPRRASPRGS